MKPQILIVEDEPAIADTLLYALKKEGFNVHWAQLGGEAEEWLSCHSADGIVLDVGLPDTNGFELCKRIRQNNTQVPIIFLTARKEEVDRIVGLEIGGDDYVVKPFSPRELVARIKAILRRASRSDDIASQSVAPSLMQHDVNRQCIVFSGEAVDLTLYEYRILLALLERAGHVLSRAQLMDAAWSDPSASFDRAVDTHIKGIRARLKSIRPDLDPIRTHRGLGYSLSLS